MNGLEGRDRSSLHVIGKGFLIALVTFFSSLGFVLGYYVGKNGREGISAGNGQVMEMIPAQREIVRTQTGERGDLINETAGERPEQRENSQTVSSPSQEEVSPSATRISDNSAAAEPVPDDTMSVRSREVASDGARPKLPATGGKETRAQKSALVYTVQLGAFKSETEADNFRSIYDKKGYEPYITVSRNKNNEKIYRIRSGEFRERKSAEILAMKLKKTEGLNSYVTFKNE